MTLKWCPTRVRVATAHLYTIAILLITWALRQTLRHHGQFSNCCMQTYRLRPQVSRILGWWLTRQQITLESPSLLARAHITLETVSPTRSLRSLYSLRHLDHDKSCASLQINHHIFPSEIATFPFTLVACTLLHLPCF